MQTGSLRPLSFGEILDGAFVLYRRHHRVLLGLGIAGALPWLAALLLVAAGPDESPLLAVLLVCRFVAAWVSTALSASVAAEVLGFDRRVRAEGLDVHVAAELIPPIPAVA
jgi:hypothetical protein